MSDERKPVKTEVRIFRTVDANIDVDVDEVLRALDDDDLAAALERRAKQVEFGRRSLSRLTLIYEEFARRGDAPKVLKDYLYDMIGRIL